MKKLQNTCYGIWGRKSSERGLSLWTKKSMYAVSAIN